MRWRQRVCTTVLLLRKAHIVERGRVPRGVFLNLGDILVLRSLLGIVQETTTLCSQVSVFADFIRTSAKKGCG